MRWKLAALAAACLLFENAAWAHRIDEYLQATILSLEANRVHASMRLVPGTLVAPSLIALIDCNHDGVFSEAERRAYAERVLGDLSIMIDGQTARPQLDTWNFPEPSELRDGLGEISIQYHVDLPSGRGSDRSLVLVNHHLTAGSVYLMNIEVPQDDALRILRQKRDDRQSIYEVDYGQQRGAVVPGDGLLARMGLEVQGLPFPSLFRLGMRHIREGPDHLLFLLVLLLPAPLLVVGSRWCRVSGIRGSLTHMMGIVTAFTLGHSLTLTLAAMHFVHPVSRVVEVLVACSILFTAVHALRPIFPGREAWIAAFFGLIHGLAFAATLQQLGLSGWRRIAGIFAFNLGIETMQLIVVALVLPSLLLMSRTRAYPALRISGAVFAGAASVAWIAERLFNVWTPVDALLQVTAGKGVLGVILLFALSVTCKFFPGFSRTFRWQQDQRAPRRTHPEVDSSAPTEWLQ